MQPPEPPTQNQYNEILKDRDEWKRKAVEAVEQVHKGDNLYRALAIQNHELRKALEDVHTIHTPECKGATFGEDCTCFIQKIRDALALTPTQAEKIVAAMEDVIPHARDNAYEDGCDEERALWHALAALDAAKRGE